MKKVLAAAVFATLWTSDPAAPLQAEQRFVESSGR